MKKIKEILVGTNNEGKYKEICDLLPREVKKYSPKKFNLLSPEETGKSVKENSFIKAKYFSKKTNLICLSDDSGLEIDLLNNFPGIYSARWSGKKSNFDLAIKKVFKKNGIVPIECINKKFDPNFHQAMMEVENNTKDPGTVVQEIQKGYMMKDRLLRPSLVGVAKKREENTKNGEKK